MFARLSALWIGLDKMDVVVTVMGCITLAALYAAFLM
jgi:hypothetical protein